MMSMALLSRTASAAMSTSPRFALLANQTRGLKRIMPPKSIDNILWPMENRPQIVPKVPVNPNMYPPIKMQRMSRLMVYPERTHVELIHKQFGIQAIGGGRLKFCHFEVMRKKAERYLDFERQFLVYRVDPPWQSCTKRPVGFTLGGGKGNIHHYVSPVAPGRIVCEVGGDCEYEEVEIMMTEMARLMPFAARAVTYEMLQKEKEKELITKEQNMNPYTFEYLLKNNMGNCRRHVKKVHLQHFEKYYYERFTPLKYYETHWKKKYRMPVKRWKEADTIRMRAISL